MNELNLKDLHPTFGKAISSSIMLSPLSMDSSSLGVSVSAMPLICISSERTLLATGEAVAQTENGQCWTAHRLFSMPLQEY